MVDRHAPWVLHRAPPRGDDWIPYKTNSLHFLEPREFECTVAMHVVASGMAPEALGWDVSLYRATWPPSHMTFRALNSLLEAVDGPASAFLWRVTQLKGAEVFSATEGTYGVHVKWIHPDNRLENTYQDCAFDPDSNYQHAALWMADRRILYWTDVAVAAPEDLADMDAWMQRVYDEYGLMIPMQPGRVRQLMLNTRSRWCRSTAYFAPEFLP